MAKLYLIVSALFLNHEVLSQLLRPLGLTKSPLADITSPHRFLQQLEPARQHQLIDSLPYISQLNPYSIIDISGIYNAPDTPNILINLPSSAIKAPNPLINRPSTPLIIPNLPLKGPNSECSPSVCKNLGNTIKLIMLSDYLQDKDGGDQVVKKMATQIENELFSKVSGGSSYVAKIDNDLFSKVSEGSNYVSKIDNDLFSKPIVSGGSRFVSKIDNDLFSKPIVSGGSNYLSKIDSYLLSKPIVSGGSPYVSKIDNDLFSKVSGGSNYVSKIDNDLFSKVSGGSHYLSNSGAPNLKSSPRIVVSISSGKAPPSFSRIAAGDTSNILSTASTDGRIERDLLAKLLKSLGGV